LVAPVPYGQALQIIASHQKSLETYYLPELLYYRIGEFRDSPAAPFVSCLPRPLIA
jgi:hypothetical protein